MPDSAENKPLDRLAKAAVHLSWLTRLARETVYASGVEGKAFPEKSAFALWLLRLKSPLNITAIARFLRLSTERARKFALKPLLEQKLVREQEGDQPLFLLTEKGQQRLDQLVTETAQHYRDLLAVLPTLEKYKGDLEQFSKFIEELRDVFDRYIRMWVFGQHMA